MADEEKPGVGYRLASALLEGNPLGREFMPSQDTQRRREMADINIESGRRRLSQLTDVAAMQQADRALQDERRQYGLAHEGVARVNNRTMLDAFAPHGGLTKDREAKFSDSPVVRDMNTVLTAMFLDKQAMGGSEAARKSRDRFIADSGYRRDVDEDGNVVYRDVHGFAIDFDEDNPTESIHRYAQKVGAESAAEIRRKEWQENLSGRYLNGTIDKWMDMGAVRSLAEGQQRIKGIMESKGVKPADMEALGVLYGMEKALEHNEAGRVSMTQKFAEETLGKMLPLGMDLKSEPGESQSIKTIEVSVEGDTPMGDFLGVPPGETADMTVQDAIAAAKRNDSIPRLLDEWGRQNRSPIDKAELLKQTNAQNRVIVMNTIGKEGYRDMVGNFLAQNPEHEGGRKWSEIDGEWTPGDGTVASTDQAYASLARFIEDHHSKFINRKDSGVEVSDVGGARSKLSDRPKKKTRKDQAEDEVNDLAGTKGKTEQGERAGRRAKALAEMRKPSEKATTESELGKILTEELLGPVRDMPSNVMGGLAQQQIEMWSNDPRQQQFLRKQRERIAAEKAADARARARLNRKKK